MLTPSALRVAFLCSGRAPGLLHLLAQSPGRGLQWEIVCCLTSEETFAEEPQVAALGVPVVHHPVRRFYAEQLPGARLGDLQAREAYDRRTTELLEPFSPDLIVLGGYLLLLTTPMLTAFEDRIVNVHHADLQLRVASGGPRYPGLRAVRDAILAGEIETRCSAHLVTAGLDDGPALLRSRPFPVAAVAGWARLHGEHDVLRKVIWAHQEWMLRAAFGPLLEQVLDVLSGRIPDVAEQPGAFCAQEEPPTPLYAVADLVTSFRLPESAS